MNLSLPFIKRPPLVAILPLNGMIGSGGRFGSGGLNDAALEPLIEKAFSKGKPAAVALAINSPGGSPVQSSLIAARIRRLSEEKEVPVFAFVEDLAASGGYWLASAADEIYVDRASIVGSIGVIYAGFGFNSLMKRYGIERRVHTAGKDKSLLDPFRPEREEDVERLKRLQAKVHDGFIAQVKARRGDKLDTAADLFSGDVWVGEEAVALGLADGLGHLVPRIKERFGPKTRFTTHGRRRSFFARLGMRAMEDAAGLVEERALWAQYGL